MTTLRSRISDVGKELWANFRPAKEAVLSLREVGLRRRAEFQRLRKSPEYQAVYDNPEPLVSILIATYNRAQLLRDRSLRSCLEQTYSNIEVIVVGDCCTDDTAAIMAEVDDTRVRFVNLPERGNYPADPYLRYLVAGTKPVNQALALARGDFITHLDDDDEHAPDRTQELLECIREKRSDLVFHPFRCELPDGQWLVNEAEKFHCGRVTTSSIFYHRHFRSLPWDPLAWRLGEPGDWNRLRKIKFMGAKVQRDSGIHLAHYREQNQAKP